MLNKPDKKTAANAEELHGQDAKKATPKSAWFMKMPVILGGVMVLEAAVLFAGIKYLRSEGPNAAAGATLVESEAPADKEESKSAAGNSKAEGPKNTATSESRKIGPKEPVELLLVQFRATNKLSGQSYMYDVSIHLMTHGEHLAAAKTTIQNREALIKDRIRTIIAQSDPDKLGGGSEPGLETLRRQIKYQLEQILGEGVVDEVLIPKCLPFRTE